MKKALKIILIFVLILAALLFIVRSFDNVYVTAVFDELEPFPNNLNVYYKGFKLGRSLRVYPSKDFKSTRIDMVLNARNLSLPGNVTAKVKSKNKHDYIEIIYPDEPMLANLKNRSVIQGKKGLNIASYISDSADSGDLDEIKENLNTTIQAAGETMEALTGMLKIGTDILTDLRPSLKSAGENLAVTTQNLAEVSAELNASTKPKRLKNSFENIELITSNIERSTRNFELVSSNAVNITNQVNSDTARLTNCVIKNINTVVCNINDVINNIDDIVKGFKTTLSKRFGGARIIFGTPLEK